MPIILKRKPVLNSFISWLNECKGCSDIEIGNVRANESFLIFVKTIMRYNATNWQNANYLSERILELRPHFNREQLEHYLNLLIDLVDFYNVDPVLSRCQGPEAMELDVINNEIVRID